MGAFKKLFALKQGEDYSVNQGSGDLEVAS